jgi:hypothetical protein
MRKLIRSLALVAASYRLFALAVGMGIPALPTGRWRCAARSRPSARPSRWPRRPRRMITGRRQADSQLGQGLVLRAGRCASPAARPSAPRLRRLLRGRRLSSSRSCLTGAAEPGWRLLDFLSRRSERRAVRNVLLLRPHGLLMRDPTPQQIEMVHRMRDARRLIVRASRLPSGWANEAVANGHGKVFWLATAGQLQCLCPQR